MSPPVTVAFQAALPQEVQPFLRRVGAGRLSEPELPVWEFTRRAGRGLVVVSGMGEDAAARAAAWVLEHHQPQSLVALGFGGAVTPELPAGAMVLGDSYWRYDPQTKGLQELAAPPFPAWSLALEDKLRAAGLPVSRGSLVSTRGIISKADHGDLLTHLAHPVLDMETSAAVVAAQVRNLPFLALRAITDVAGEEIPDFLAQAVQQGKTPTAGEALAWLAAQLRRLPILYRLWQRSRLAARHLAQALEMVLEVW
jgi:adenosylhomocysteine nucleosidase